MSFLALDKPFEGLTRDFHFRGLVFTILEKPDYRDWLNKNAELAVKFGVDTETPEGEKSDKQIKREAEMRIKASGAAQVGTQVIGCEPFEIETADGPLMFEWDKPAPNQELYETMGEELLAESPEIADAIFKEFNRLSRNRPDYEITALKKSSEESDSGTNGTKKETS